MRLHTGTARLAGAALLVAVAAAMAACGSDGNGPTGPGDVSGTYTLASVSGQGLPYTVQGSNTNIIINSATEVLANGAYDIDGEGSDNGGPGRIITDHGTYTVSGSTITFESSEFPVTYTATATSSGFVAAFPGSILSSSTATFTFTYDKSN